MDCGGGSVSIVLPEDAVIDCLAGCYSVELNCRIEGLLLRTMQHAEETLQRELCLTCE
jgi:hypothetical protein